MNDNISELVAFHDGGISVVNKTLSNLYLHTTDLRAVLKTKKRSG